MQSWEPTATSTTGSPCLAASHPPAQRPKAPRQSWALLQVGAGSSKGWRRAGGIGSIFTELLERFFSQKSSRGVPFPNLTSSASGRCEIPHLVQLIQRQIKIGARKSGSSVYLEVLDLVSAEGRHCKAWDPSSTRLF